MSRSQPVIGFMAQLGTFQQSQEVCLRNCTSHFLHHAPKLTFSLEEAVWSFPGGPVVENTLQCRGLGFDPWSGS